MSLFFAIAVDRATTQQLNAVHELVKQHANGWWHHHTNLWIVGASAQNADTKRVSFWRDLIKPVLAVGQAKILVLRLPSEADGRWWASTKDDGVWLRKTYTKKTD